MFKKSVLVLLALLAMQSSVRGQSRLEVQEAAVKAILAMGEFGEVRSELGYTLSMSTRRIEEIRTMMLSVEDPDGLATLQADLDTIVARVDFTTDQYRSNRLRYWDAGSLMYDMGCMEEVMDNRLAAIGYFNNSESLFRDGKDDAAALLLDAHSDLSALNAMTCHELFE